MKYNLVVRHEYEQWKSVTEDLDAVNWGDGEVDHYVIGTKEYCEEYKVLYEEKMEKESGLIAGIHYEIKVAEIDFED